MKQVKQLVVFLMAIVLIIVPNLHTEAKTLKEAIVVKDGAGRTVIFKSVPTRIVALNGGDLEVVYALGGKVVGRHTTSVPVTEAAQKVEQVGTAHAPNFEKIAALQPDLVLASASLNNRDLVKFNQLNAKVLLSKSDSIADVRQNIVTLGKVLNKAKEAKTIVAKLDGELKKVDKAKAAKKALLIYGAPGTFLAALPNSLSGDVLAKAGGKNIADDFKATAQYPQYASLNIERVIAANPDVIFLITHGDPAQVKEAFKKTYEKNPAWSKVRAVEKDNFIVLPSHLFGTNPGTKIVDAVEFMAKSLNEVN